MFDNVTLSQLHDLYLSAMAACFKEQQERTDIKALSFEDRFGLLVEAEWLHRHNKRTERLIRQAGFRFSASIEDIDYLGKRDLPKARYSSSAFAHTLKKHRMSFSAALPV